MPKRVKVEGRISTTSVGLENRQLKWLENNPDFPLSKFLRDRLTEHIEFMEELNAT